MDGPFCVWRVPFSSDDGTAVLLYTGSDGRRERGGGAAPCVALAPVLDTFIRRGRLTQIPAQHKKRQIILEKLAEEFEPDREYAEREVNQILVEFHDHVATLRRGLIDRGLMERAEGIYRRVVSTPDG